MLKTCALLISTFCAAVTSLSASYSVEIPTEFYIKQRWLSWTTSFDIESKDKKLGQVRRRFFSLALNYDFHDNDDVLQANAKRRFWSFGTIFDVVDAYERPIGRVEEKLSFFFPTFEIISTVEQKMAQAELNFWGTKYTITDPFDQHVIATLTRPFFRLKNDWTVTIYDRHIIREGSIDPRLFVIVAAFQTDMDYWNSQMMQINNPKLALLEEMEQKTPLLDQLEIYRNGLEGIDPSAEDIEKVEVFVDAYLRKLNGQQSWSSKTRLQAGFHTLCELFSTDELSLSEKSALFLMLESFLKQ